MPQVEKVPILESIVYFIKEIPSTFRVTFFTFRVTFYLYSTFFLTFYLYLLFSYLLCAALHSREHETPVSICLPAGAAITVLCLHAIESTHERSDQHDHRFTTFTGRWDYVLCAHNRVTRCGNDMGLATRSLVSPRSMSQIHQRLGLFVTFVSPCESCRYQYIISVIV